MRARRFLLAFGIGWMEVRLALSRRSVLSGSWAFVQSLVFGSFSRVAGRFVNLRLSARPELITMCVGCLSACSYTRSILCLHCKRHAVPGSHDGRAAAMKDCRARNDIHWNANR